VHTHALLKEAVLRVYKFRWVVLAMGLLVATAAFIFTKSRRTTYTAKATLFPLMTPNDNSISSSMLQGVLGLSDAPKSFSSEATINIIELAQSRRIREEVASARLPAFNNKTISELLMEDMNEHRAFFEKQVSLPKDSTELVVKGGELLKDDIVAKMNKNGVLELYFTGRKEALITPISNVIVEQISKFYVDIKQQKAITDHDFTQSKIDSLQGIISGIDRRSVGMQQRTLFTPPDLLQYSIPKENLMLDKNRLIRQRDMYINNRDEALWRLQKATPIIAVLDKPTAPFEVKKQPLLLMVVIGFMAGALRTTFLLTIGSIWKHLRAELRRSIMGG